LNVWCEPKGLECAICGKFKKHGIGIEGPGKIDVDVCDDCAGCQVMLGVDAARIARKHIAQGKTLHEKLKAMKKEKGPWRKKRRGIWRTKTISKRVKVSSYERGGKP